MNLFSRFKREDEVTETRSESSSAILPPSRSEVPVTTGEAFSLSAVYRAIFIISTAVKQLSLDVYRGNEPIRIPLFIAQPDSSISRSAFLEEVVISLASSGNAYLLIERDPKGSVMNIICLNPFDCHPNVDVKGNVIDYSYQGSRYSKNNIRHLKLLRVPGKSTGLGPIQAANQELRGAIDLRDYASNFIGGDSGVPNGTLTTDQELGPEQAQAAKDSWNQAHSHRQGVAVLGNGLRYEATLLSPKDAQFLESQQFSITQIARLFGVPASLLLAAVDGSSMTYSNLESEYITFARFTLTAYTREIEDALSGLLPRSQEVRFNFESLLRTDTATRYAAHATAISNGFLAVDEVREIENRPPLKDTQTQTQKAKEPIVDVSDED